MVIINPGSGPVEGSTFAHAFANIEALVKDIDLPEPAITIASSSTGDDGRYTFVLRRGIRDVDIDMPGRPIDEVRYVDGQGQNAWHFPRLYVEGSSWLWVYAVLFARDALVDHDRAIQSSIDASERRCELALDTTPRCLDCGTVRIMEQKKTPNPRAAGGNDWGEYQVICLGCQPQIEERRENLRGAVFGDDSWKCQVHYFVRRQRMAPEAPDSRCARLTYRNEPCRLRSGHHGACELYWKELEKTLVRT